MRFGRFDRARDRDPETTRDDRETGGGDYRHRRAVAGDTAGSRDDGYGDGYPDRANERTVVRDGAVVRDEPDYRDETDYRREADYRRDADHRDGTDYRDDRDRVVVREERGAVA